VIIQYSQAKKAAREDEEAREVDLQMAADLAAFYSDLRNERKAEVMFCNPKHISKPRKAPVGAVRVSKEGGTVLGRPEDVPDDCKEARAERGVQNDGGWG
jgi:predicted ribosome quality control (RQC) complex YloA/Tae2 family protein